MNIQVDELKIIALFLLFVRVAFFVMLFPIFGDEKIPGQIKIFLSVLIAWVFFTSPVAQLQVNPLILKTSVVYLLVLISKEMLVGLVLGAIARLSFFAVLMAGEFISSQMGFNLAGVYDPQMNQQLSQLQRFLQVGAVLLFLAFGGHYYLLQALGKSIEIVPLGQAAFSPEAMHLLTEAVVMVFQVAIRLAAPVLVVTMSMNAAMGLVARAVPQMNVMMVAFSVNILLGFALLFIGLPYFYEGFKEVTIDFSRASIQALKVLSY